jgi:hypothetical protein
VTEIFFVVDQDQSIEIFTIELILEANIENRQCKKLCHEVGPFDTTINIDDFVVAANVEIVMMTMKIAKPRLNFPPQLVVSLTLEPLEGGYSIEEFESFESE